MSNGWKGLGQVACSAQLEDCHCRFRGYSIVASNRPRDRSGAQPLGG